MLFLSFTLFCASVLAGPTINGNLDPINEESLYTKFKMQMFFESNKALFSGFSSTEQKLFVDAIWDSWDEGDIPNLEKVLPLNETLRFFSTVERLRVQILKIKSGLMESFDPLLLEEIESALSMPQVDKRLVYTIAANEDLINKGNGSVIVSVASRNEFYSEIANYNHKSKQIPLEVVSDLYFNTPDSSTYLNGKYSSGIKIFMFCRSKRVYPCLMVMRDMEGINVRKDNGVLWSQPALAAARSGFPTYQRNGNTPAGIFTIDSVMPYADQQLSFGKFRRLILNFVPASNNERVVKSMLPVSSHESDWWKQTVVARDIGRNLFRIHGSGRMNNEPQAPYFPLNPTNGCIAQRENTYNGVTYKDQRDLLDEIMKNLNLEPTFSNETKINGILYVLELDDKNSAVRLEDLEVYGIK